MYRIYQSLIAAVAIAAVTADTSSCKATGDACVPRSGVDKTASDYGVYAQDMVLMQLRTITTMPKVTWSESDPLLDEDFPEDDQPGGQDLTRPASAAAQNVSPHVQLPEQASLADSEPASLADGEPASLADGGPVQVAQVQASLRVSQKQDPADKEQGDAAPAGADAAAAAEAPASPTQVTTPPPASETPEDSAATPGVTTSDAASNEAASNASGNVTVGAENSSGNSTANATSDVVNASGTSCATRADDRIKSWFASPAAPGSPCVFGVDVRDENSHCVYDNGVYGSYGWCFTSSDRSEWGACNEHCPLSGPPSVLGAKLDNVSAKLDKVVAKLSPGISDDEAEDESNNAKPAEETADATPKGPEAGSNGGADADANAGKAKKEEEGGDADAATGKGKGKGKGTA